MPRSIHGMVAVLLNGQIDWANRWIIYFRVNPILSSHPLLGQTCHLPVHPCPGLIHLVDLLFGKNNFEYPSCTHKGPEEVDSLEHVQYIRQVPEWVNSNWSVMHMLWGQHFLTSPRLHRWWGRTKFQNSRELPCRWTSWGIAGTCWRSTRAIGYIVMKRDIKEFLFHNSACKFWNSPSPSGAWINDLR